MSGAPWILGAHGSQQRLNWLAMRRQMWRSARASMARTLTLESRPMIQAKQELQGALAVALARLAPEGAPAAAFESPRLESPKQAAHGDFAITAAMPLAGLMP